MVAPCTFAFISMSVLLGYRLSMAVPSYPIA